MLIELPLALSAKRNPRIAGGLAAGGLLASAALVAIVALFLRSEQALSDYRAADERARQQEQAVSKAKSSLEELRLGLTEEVIATSVSRLRQSQSQSQRRTIVAESLERLRGLDTILAGELDALPALAQAYERIGDLHGSEWIAEGDDVKVALESYQRASELWRTVLAAEPEDQEARRFLARSQASYVQSCRKANRHAEGQALADEAVANARALLEANPTDESRSALVSALWARSDLHIELPPTERGWTDAQEALALAQDAQARHPDDGGWLRLLAFSHFRMGLWVYYGAYSVDLGEHYDAANEAVLRCAEVERSERCAYEVMTIVNVTSNYHLEQGRVDRAASMVDAGLAAIDSMGLPAHQSLKPWTYLAVGMSKHPDNSGWAEELERRWRELDTTEWESMGQVMLMAQSISAAGWIDRPGFGSLREVALEQMVAFPDEAPPGLQDTLRSLER